MLFRGSHRPVCARRMLGISHHKRRTNLAAVVCHLFMINRDHIVRTGLLRRNAGNLYNTLKQTAPTDRMQRFAWKSC